MLREQRLFESALVTVARVDHPPACPHEDPKEEVSTTYSINFVERGGFGIYSAQDRRSLSAADVFVTVPGFVCRFDHAADDHAPEDVCLAVRFEDAGQREMTGLGIAALAHHAPVVPLSNRRAYLRERLLMNVTNGATPLAVESIAAELLVSTLSSDTAHRLFKPDQLRWYAVRVDATRERLDCEYASPFTLSELAREAGMSPYHFARIFCELTGIPPHRYLIRRRLAAAVGRLRQGASVTDACFAVGFNSLSHFDHVFRRVFGVPPSRLALPRRASGVSDDQEHR